MKPVIVGYGSAGRAPPNTLAASFEAFDGGADAIAVDICETVDGVIVVGNHRTLKMLAPMDPPTWSVLEDADLGHAFGGVRSVHRVLRLEDFLRAMGPMSVHLVLAAPLGGLAREGFADIVRSRSEGETTLVGPPSALADAELPEHVRCVATMHTREDASDVARGRYDAIAAPARSLPTLGRLRLPLVALGCDTRGALAAALSARASTVHTERPAWLRWTWEEPGRAYV